jgi:hypothetical protein
VVARTGVSADDFNLLQDTGQVVWGAFQRVVLRRLLDVVEPRVYFCLQRHQDRVYNVKNSPWNGALSTASSDAYTRWTEERPTQTMVQSQHVVRLKRWVRIQPYAQHSDQTHQTFQQFQIDLEGGSNLALGVRVQGINRERQLQWGHLINSVSSRVHLRAHTPAEHKNSARGHLPGLRGCELYRECRRRWRSA